MTDTRLWDACQQLLDLCADALDGEMAAGQDLLPDVSAVQMGPTWAWDDCERLIVHPEDIVAVQAAPSGSVPVTQPPPGEPGVVRPAARMVATFLYCVPKVGDDGQQIPSSAAIGAASERLHVAGMTVWRAIARARRDGLLGDGCGGVTLERAQPTGAQGGYAGWRFTVLVDLTGIVAGS